MRQRIFKSLYFLFRLAQFKLKMFLLRKNILCFGLTGSQRLFKRGVLIRNQEQALLEYGGRPMLSDEFFDTFQKSHVKAPDCGR